MYKPNSFFFWMLLAFAQILSAAHANTIIRAGSVLQGGTTIEPENGKHVLAMQHDGNLVLYRKRDMFARWHTVTHQHAGSYAIMQDDGNLVVISAAGKPLWASRTGGNSGAYLVIQNDGNLVIYRSDGKSIWSVGADTNESLRSPQAMGEIVGRDLAYPGLSWAGHVGIWDGDKVIEVLNEGGNVVRINTISDFQSRSPYWGVVSPNYPNTSLLGCFETTCPVAANPLDYMRPYKYREIIVKRSHQIRLVGADYTQTAQYTSALPKGGPRHPPTRGVYRCDTFVLDLLRTTQPTNTYLVSGADSRWTFNSGWSQRMRDAFNFSVTLLTPSILFSKAKTL